MAKKIKGEVALVNDHGQNFAVVAVSDDAVADPRMREAAIAAFEDQFGAPTVLLSESGKTWGPEDLVDWLSRTPLERLPWRELSVKKVKR
jgi:hypothetical protein